MRWRGVLSILLLVLAWLALDDITTDNATAFILEYSILVTCGAWFTGVGVWLLARRRPVLGILSLLAMALAVLAFWSLPYHYAPPTPVNYLGLVSLGWFLALAIWLLARCSGAPRAQPAAQA